MKNVYLLVGLALAISLGGCSSKSQQKKEVEIKKVAKKPREPKSLEIMEKIDRIESGCRMANLCEDHQISSTSGDFDGDGSMDLIVIFEKRDRARIYLYLNDGSGTFPNREYLGYVIANNDSGVTVESADFDSDSDVDLIVGGVGTMGAYLYLMRNDGKGNFSTKKKEIEKGEER